MTLPLLGGLNDDVSALEMNSSSRRAFGYVKLGTFFHLDDRTVAQTNHSGAVFSRADGLAFLNSLACRNGIAACFGYSKDRAVHCSQRGINRSIRMSGTLREEYGKEAEADYDCGGYRPFPNRRRNVGLPRILLRCRRGDRCACARFFECLSAKETLAGMIFEYESASVGQFSLKIIGYQCLKIGTTSYLFHGRSLLNGRGAL